ncbi:flavodoxin family protein [Candidatus Kaiserbacteria bacterium]|nr:flavodoxin family protein [Candidatus Kaiserbacteria bacterium]
MATKSPFIIGVNGSPHTDGIVYELLNAVMEAAAKAGAETRIINLYELLMIPTPGNYSRDHASETIENAPKDDITALYPEILRSDALVLATPVYWANMSAVMKNFIEHLTPLESDGFHLEGKLAAVIAASKENEGGVEMAAMAMVAPLMQMGMLMPPNSVMWYPGQWMGGRTDYTDWAKREAPEVGRSMVELISLLREHPIEWTHYEPGF